MALLLYTAQRRSDVIQMGPQHIRNRMIYVRPQKTKRHGTELVIPMHPELARIIAATKCGNLAFLTTEAGAAYTNGTGLGNRFRQWCDEAGLPQCSAHGLRKAACRRLAEAGCTAHEIMAISGHKTLAEAQRYTAAADQARLAHQAVGKIIVPEQGRSSSRTLAEQRLHYPSRRITLPSLKTKDKTAMVSIPR